MCNELSANQFEEDWSLWVQFSNRTIDYCVFSKFYLIILFVYTILEYVRIWETFLILIQPDVRWKNLASINEIELVMCALRELCLYGTGIQRHDWIQWHEEKWNCFGIRNVTKNYNSMMNFYIFVLRSGAKNKMKYFFSEIVRNGVNVVQSLSLLYFYNRNSW